MNNKNDGKKRTDKRGNKPCKNKKYDPKHSKSYRGKPNYDREEVVGTKASACNTSTWDKYHSNDPSWWNRTGVLFNTASQIPFNRIAGQSYVLGTEFSLRNPVVMRVNYIPGIGKCTSYTDAPNRAFQAMYAYIYSKTTGAMQFPQYALAMLVTSMSSVAQNIALAKRALGSASLYTAANRTYPRCLVEAMGFNFNSIKDMRADYTAQLDAIIKDFNTLVVPADIPVFARQYAMANSVYLDNANLQAQLYIMVPELYYLYSDLGTYDESQKSYDGKAVAMPVRYPDDFYNGVGLDMDLFLHIIEKQIYLIRNSADYALIAGSLMRAYESSAFLQLDYVDTNYIQELTVDDPYISYQIHNSNAVGNVATTAINWPNLGQQKAFVSGAITGDPVSNMITYNPHLAPSLPVYPMKLGVVNADGSVANPLLLNTFESTVDANWLVEATRLCSYWNADGTPYSISTEFITSYDLYKVDAQGGGVNSGGFLSEVSIDLEDMGLDEVGSIVNNLCDVSRFHKAPRVYVQFGPVGLETEPTKMLGDLNFWTTVSPIQLRGLNTAALMSIFGIDF